MHLLHWLWMSLMAFPFLLGEVQVQDSSGASGSQPTAPAAPAGGAPTPSPGQAAPGASQGTESQGIAQLRTAYESIKKEYEPWQNLGVKPEQVSQFQSVYQRTFEEVGSIGRALGYPDDEIIEALQENPVATLDYLRDEMARAQQGQQQDRGDAQLQDLIEQRVQEGIAPIQEWQNQRLTQEANSLFERTAYQLAAESFKKEGLDIANVPQDELFLLTSATSEILKYDEDALRALKYQGSTAAVQKAFTEAQTMLDKYYLARRGRDGGAPAQRGAQQQQAQRGPNGQFKKPSLDDLIQDPGIISQKYAERT